MRYELAEAIHDDAERARLETEIKRWITEDEQVQQKYWAEWNEIESRMNSTEVPMGYSTTYSKNFATRNDVTVDPVTKDQTRDYVTVQRIRPNHETTLGDFVSMRRRLQISGRTPHDRARAKVLKQIVTYYEDVQLLPERVYFPAMDSSFAKGLGWAKGVVNPYGASLRERISWDFIGIRDVLVDNGAMGPFFEKSRRLTHRSKLPVEQAKKAFLHYPLFDPDTLKGDNDYDLAYGHNPDRRNWSEYATFYDVEFHRIEPSFYVINPETKELKEIPEELYRERMKNRAAAQLTFRGPDEDVFYVAKYNPTVGLFGIEYNPFGMYRLIPLVGIETDGRVYPLGDVPIYSNLTDLLDVLVTVFLENAKRTNIPIADIDPKMWELYQTQIESALKHGGAAPGIRNVFTTQPINTHLVNLVPFVIEWIQDSVSKHSASMGEVPSRQIAKETVQSLIRRDRTAQGRKDVCLKYMLTQISRLTVKMITSFYDEPDFVPVVDAVAGAQDYIPINKEWTEEEYLANIAAVFGLQVPQPPQMSRYGNAPAQVAIQQQYEQQAVQFEQQLAAAKQMFETENDVKMEEREGFSIEGQQLVTVEQLQALVEQSGITPEEFATIYQVQNAMVPVYVVNKLEQDVDMSITYQIDSDATNDPQFKTDRALLLHQQGGMALLDTLREIGMPDAEGVARRAQEENQMIQIAKEIANNPEMMAAFQAMMQGIKLAPQGNGSSGGNGKPKKEPAKA